jgi:hypothetical protein
MRTRTEQKREAEARQLLPKNKRTVPHTTRLTATSRWSSAVIIGLRALEQILIKIKTSIIRIKIRIIGLNGVDSEASAYAETHFRHVALESGRLAFQKGY